MSDPTDEDEAPHDVDLVELVDLRRPVRREVVRRSYAHHGFPEHLSIAEIHIARHQLGCSEPASYAPVRGLIVGENPGKHTHPDMPLFPWPPTSSAGRLVGMSGVTAGEYLGGFYRRNLVDARAWDAAAAARRARSIVTALFEMPRDFAVVLCGRKVREAFGLRSAAWEPVRLESRQICVAIPHPSGLNHVYNDQSARDLTRRWIRWAALGEEMPK